MRLPRCVCSNRYISLGSNIIHVVADLGVDATELTALAAVVTASMCVGDMDKEGRPPTPSHSEVRLVDFQGGWE